MKAIIQRSKQASVTIDGKIVGKIKSGLVILLGISKDDTSEKISPMIDKILNLRIFEKENKEFDQSILDTGKEILLISQFTLYANMNKGRRPDFEQAAKSDVAEKIYDEFKKELENRNQKFECGVFGAEMKVNLLNDGPVTLILEI